MAINQIGGLHQSSIQCPFCMETISIAVDLTQDSRQEFIYDCEVCCRAIQIRVHIEQHEVQIEASRAYD